MQKVRLGPLGAVLTPPANEAAQTLWVVLLHGFGAPATDLVGLTGALGSLPGVRFAFPGALHALNGPFAPPGGRAWWPIDFGEFDGAKRRRDLDALAHASPIGLSEARDALGEALAVLEREHGMTPERLVVGGFSQGAMLACDWALRSDRPLAGLALLSGMPIALGEWEGLLAARRGLPVFQSHSPDDIVLPFELAERLAQVFARADLDSEFVSFRGGHGIPLAVIDRLRAFLARLTGEISA
jgi:phospholipase/carboxylesterase